VEIEEEEEYKDEEEFASEREIAEASTCEDVHRCSTQSSISTITFLDVEERRRFSGLNGPMLEASCAISS